jgi:glutaredoxin-like YruB-family protein
MVKVVVYSTPECSHCKNVKAWLKENNVEFENIDVSTDEKKAEEMIERSGQQSVPVIFVGEKMIVGEDIQALKEALGKD